jgi:hypothetical protein
MSGGENKVMARQSDWADLGCNDETEGGFAGDYVVPGDDYVDDVIALSSHST